MLLCAIVYHNFSVIRDFNTFVFLVYHFFIFYVNISINCRTRLNRFSINRHTCVWLFFPRRTQNCNTFSYTYHRFLVCFDITITINVFTINQCKPWRLRCTWFLRWCVCIILKIRKRVARCVLFIDYVLQTKMDASGQPVPGVRQAYDCCRKRPTTNYSHRKRTTREDFILYVYYHYYYVVGFFFLFH